MKIKIQYLLTAVAVTSILCLCVLAQRRETENSQYISYTVNPKKQKVNLFWKDDQARIFKSIGNLKTWLSQKQTKLVFAMNGGMYKADNSPVGLFIQHQKIITPIDTASGAGNFYLKPNGIFYLTTSDSAFVVPANEFTCNKQIKFATQSGPMLLVNGKIHSAFTKSSTNRNIRNGVGILPGNMIVFAMSETPVSFYEFAAYFKTMGCKNALYLDGLVSRTYLPEKNWLQTDGNFGVIIGVTEK